MLSKILMHVMYAPKKFGMSKILLGIKVDVPCTSSMIRGLRQSLDTLLSYWIINIVSCMIKQPAIWRVC